jgi:hypothetical protein
MTQSISTGATPAVTPSPTRNTGTPTVSLWRTYSSTKTVSPTGL